MWRSLRNIDKHFVFKEKTQFCQDSLPDFILWRAGDVAVRFKRVLEIP